MKTYPTTALSTPESFADHKEDFIMDQISLCDSCENRGECYDDSMVVDMCSAYVRDTDVCRKHCKRADLGAEPCTDCPWCDEEGNL